MIERRGALLLAIASRGNLRRSFYVFSNPASAGPIHFSTNRQGNLAKIALPSVIMRGCYSLLQKGCGGAMRPTPEDVVIPIVRLPEIQMSIPGGRLALFSAPGSATVWG